jgi:hypothetical protein
VTVVDALSRNAASFDAAKRDTLALPVAKPRKPIHICGTCGGWFNGHRGNANKFCSVDCTPKRRMPAKWVTK